MGSVGPRDAALCNSLAASYSGANGGLRGNVGSYSPPVDPGSPDGAADLTPTTTRGKPYLYLKTHSLKCGETAMV